MFDLVGSMREVQMKRASHRQLIISSAAALIAAGCGLISPANAQTFSGSYTSTAPKDCRTIGKPENGSTAQVRPCEALMKPVSRPVFAVLTSKLQA
ncbi:hypothetical protein [Bradyrhizobium sp. AZCC 1693]|uniref:hypothetical protein n=1 Tax=Bradyrhizobium sp. AZCC 1693 TaxID=3117029 RepID=UPI002FF3EAE1